MIAAHTTPANRTWQRRRYEEIVLQTWRVIANSGPRGISFADIRTRLNDIDAEALKAHLHELRRKGHTYFNSTSGSTRYGCWIASTTLPPTEDPPIWMQSMELAGTSTADPEANDPANPADMQTKADEVLAAARALPNSVFAVTSEHQTFGVDIDAVHMPPKHLQALAAAAPPAEPPAAPPAAAEEEPIPKPAQAVFAYSSDHRFLMRRADGQTIVLEADETAALMRYLGVLLAFDPSALAQEQAA